MATKEEIKRQVQSRVREKIRERAQLNAPIKKSLAGFEENFKEDISSFGKGMLHIGSQAVRHPVESIGTVFGLGSEILKQAAIGTPEFAKSAWDVISNPIETAKQFKKDWDTVRDVSYNEQKKLIEEFMVDLNQGMSKQYVQKEKKILANLGTAVATDVLQEITHPVEFMYDKPFTFGLDALAIATSGITSPVIKGTTKVAARGLSKVGKAVEKTGEAARKIKYVDDIAKAGSKVLERTDTTGRAARFAKTINETVADLFTPLGKLRSKGYGGLAESLEKLYVNSLKMQEGIIRSTAQKFEKIFKLNGAERVKFFETIDAARRSGTKLATSDNPKIQSAIDWWLTQEVPKLRVQAGLPEEYAISNYLHHFFPPKLKMSERMIKPFKKGDPGYLKKSKDVEGFVKDPVVSISAIKIKVALDNMKSAFLEGVRRTYGLEFDNLQKQLKAMVGDEAYQIFKKQGRVTAEIKKRFNVDEFTPEKGKTWFVPKEVASELNRRFAPSAFQETMRKLLSPLDFFNRNWKPLATAVRPRYHTRNVIGNLYNAIVLGSMNPKNIPIAALQQIAGYINEARKIPGWKGQIARKLFPEKVPAKWIDWALKDDVIGRGFFAIDLHDMARVAEHTDDIIKVVNKYKNPAEIYRIPILRQYLNLSRNIGTALEDNARLALYIDRLKTLAGKSGKVTKTMRADAKKYVNKYLFDYLTGLGEGDKIIKKFIPFWAWSRFNIPLQISSLWNTPTRLAVMQKIFNARVDEIEKQDPNVKYMTGRERDMGLIKTGEIEVAGELYDKYIRTQSVLPQADLIRLINIFQLPPDLNEVGFNPFLQVTTNLNNNLNYFGNSIEQFTGERGKFLEGTFDKTTIEWFKTIPLLNELNKLIGGSSPEGEKFPVDIRLEQILSPLSTTLINRDEKEYFGLLEEQKELTGSYEAGLEAMYTRYYSKSLVNKEEVQYKENVMKLEEILKDKGITELGLLPLKLKALKKSVQEKIQRQAREKKRDVKTEKNQGILDKIFDLPSRFQQKIKDIFTPEAGEVRVRDITRELYSMIVPDIAQTPAEALAMGYEPVNLYSEKELAKMAPQDRDLYDKGYGMYMSPDGILVGIGPDGGAGLDVLGSVGALKQVTGKTTRTAFQGFKEITSTVLDELKGKVRVSQESLNKILKKNISREQKEMVQREFDALLDRPVTTEMIDEIQMKVSRFENGDVLMYHGTDNAAAIRKSGFIDLSKARRGEDVLWATVDKNHAKQYGSDVLEVRVPAKKYEDWLALVRRDADKAEDALDLQSMFKEFYSDDLKKIAVHDSNSRRVYAEDLANQIKMNYIELTPHEVKAPVRGLGDLSTSFVSGNEKFYNEVIYTSPFNNYALDYHSMHFDRYIDQNSDVWKKYFGHARCVDRQEGRFALELQNDLMQGGFLMGENRKQIINNAISEHLGVNRRSAVTKVQNAAGQEVNYTGFDGKTFEFKRVVKKPPEELDQEPFLKEIFPKRGERAPDGHTLTYEVPTEKLGEYLSPEADTVFKNAVEFADEQLQVLSQYKDKWSGPMLRQELKRAAQDGHQFYYIPTEETTTKIQWGNQFVRRAKGETGSNASNVRVLRNVLNDHPVLTDDIIDEISTNATGDVTINGRTYYVESFDGTTGDIALLTEDASARARERVLDNFEHEFMENAVDDVYGDFRNMQVNVDGAMKKLDEVEDGYEIIIELANGSTAREIADEFGVSIPEREIQAIKNAIRETIFQAVEESDAYVDEVMDEVIEYTNFRRIGPNGEQVPNDPVRAQTMLKELIEQEGASTAGEFDTTRLPQRMRSTAEFYKYDLRKRANAEVSGVAEVVEVEGEKFLKIPTAGYADKPVNVDYGAFALPGLLWKRFKKNNQLAKEANKEKTEYEKPRDLRPGETRVDLNTGVMYYRPVSGEVQIYDPQNPPKDVTVEEAEGGDVKILDQSSPEVKIAKEKEKQKQELEQKKESGIRNVSTIEKPTLDNLIEQYVKEAIIKPKPNPQSVPYKYNNIGSLEYHNQPNSRPDPNTGRFAAFKTPNIGYRALLKQIQWDMGKVQRGEEDWTIRSYILKYAPEHENDVENYTGVVTENTGLSPDDSLLDADIFSIAKAIAWMEGNTTVEEPADFHIATTR